MLVDLINQYSADNIGVTTETSASDAMGKEEFLQLLVAQLKCQDPLEPLKNEDFVAQLAQFNSLEQMINLNNSFDTMLQLQSMSYASSFIGKEVAWYGEEGELNSGTVLEVEFDSEVPMLNVEGQVLIEPGQVVSMGQ